MACLNSQTYLALNQQETCDRAAYYRRNAHKLTGCPRPHPRPVCSGNNLIQQMAALVLHNHELDGREPGATVNHQTSMEVDGEDKVQGMAMVSMVEEDMRTLAVA